MQQIPTISFQGESGPERIPVHLDRLIASRMLIQANSGGGKSRALRALLEGTWGRVQQIVLDPEGEFASLREMFPFVLAGPEGDVPATPETAPLLARKLLEIGASCVINLYDLSPDDRRLYVRRFLEELMQLPRDLWRPLLVVLDEAHTFAPQVGTGTAQSAQAVIALASQGRKRGFCLVAATQRLSKLHKDVAAELLNKLVGRTGLDVDLKRAADELGFDKGEAASLKTLEPGEFYAYGPALSPLVSHVRTGDVVTSHPEAGQFGSITPPAPSELRDVLAALADLPNQAQDEARTLEELQQKLEHAQAQLRQRPTEVEVREVEVIKEVPVITPEEIERLEGRAHDMIATGKDLHGLGTDILSHLSGWKSWRTRATLTLPQKPVGPPEAAPTSDQVGKRPAKLPPVQGLSAPQTRILQALGDFEALGLRSVRRSNVAVWADASPSSSAYGNNLGALRTAELVDYPSPGLVALTDKGHALIDVAKPFSRRELHAVWLERLPRPQAAIIEQLVKIFPNTIKRDALAGLVGASPASSAFGNNLGALRTLGLLDYPSPGHVVATALLFPEGLR